MTEIVPGKGRKSPALLNVYVGRSLRTAYDSNHTRDIWVPTFLTPVFEIKYTYHFKDYFYLLPPW